MTLIKSISGIRGTIGGTTNDNLTPIDAVKFAAAYGTWLKEYSGKDDLTVVNWPRCSFVWRNDTEFGGIYLGRTWD